MSAWSWLLRRAVRGVRHGDRAPHRLDHGARAVRVRRVERRADTGAQPFSIGRFFDFWWFEYTHSNPRIGQAFTYLAVQARVLRRDRDAARLPRAGARDHRARHRSLADWRRAATSRCGRSRSASCGSRCRRSARRCSTARTARTTSMAPRSSCGSSCRCGSWRDGRRRAAAARRVLARRRARRHVQRAHRPDALAVHRRLRVWQRRRHGEISRLGLAGFVGAAIGFAAISRRFARSSLTQAGVMISSA